MTIGLDTDACPNPIKEILFRAAERARPIATPTAEGEPCTRRMRAAAKRGAAKRGAAC